MSKRYGDNSVLANISLRVNETEVVAIMGPSGSGKTTLLRCIAGLELPDSGAIHVLGKPLISHSNRRTRIPGMAHEVGFVQQTLNLWPHRSALFNVAAAPHAALGLPRAVAERRALDLLRDVGLEPFANAPAATLSLGQQQRVAIARALCTQPRILLLDEVTSALDPERTADLLALVQELAFTNRTVILVTHEIGFARSAATRIVFLSDNGAITDDVASGDFSEHHLTPRAARFALTAKRLGS